MMPRADAIAVQCKCPGPEHSEGEHALVSYELVRRLRMLEERLGYALRFTSGVRCKSHNDAVGGSPRSLHLTGEAVDIESSNGSAHKAALIAEALRLKLRVIVYDFHVHVDLGRDGTCALGFKPGNEPLYWIGAPIANWDRDGWVLA